MRKSVVLLTCIVFMLVGCDKATDHKGKTPIVEVYGQYLYEEDLRSVIPVNLPKTDSIQFAKQYVDAWVEDVLFTRVAEKNIATGEKINQMVEAYRRSLIQHAYQDELVRQKLRNTIEDGEVETYYNEHKELFRLESPLIRGLFIKVPLHAKDVNMVRRWYRQKTQDAIDNLEKYSVGNAVVYEYFYDQWKSVEEEMGKFPPSSWKNDLNYLNTNRNVEVQDSEYYYFLHVEDFLAKGEVQPLDFAKDEIKEFLMNLKRVDFINQIKKELVEDATEKHDIKYYLNSEE